MSNGSALNVSLEPHLVDALTPLLSLVPPALQTKLVPYVTAPIPLTIPYGTLLAISQWSRTASGQEQLHSCTPRLDAQDYSMISLLAGTKTSPERKFGDWVPKQEPGEIEAREAKDRKAITALLNALLSILGAGIATWWAADKIGWRNEWRVLLSLFVAIVVAISEGVLYLIWHSRRSNTHAKRGRRRIISARHKKEDDDVTIATPDEKPVVEESDEAIILRRRR